MQSHCCLSIISLSYDILASFIGVFSQIVLISPSEFHMTSQHCYNVNYMFFEKKRMFKFIVWFILIIGKELFICIYFGSFF